MADSQDSSPEDLNRLLEQIDDSLRGSWLEHITPWMIEQAVAIQQIPAPTFDEAARAAYIAEQFGALGLEDVVGDELHNVYGRLPGADPDRLALMIVAHSDTVFAAGVDLRTRRDGDLIYGPGLGDNSVGVAGMLGLAAALRRQEITPPRDLWLVATSREEGLGDLGGMKAAYDRLSDRIAAVINIEGLALGHIYHAGIAVRRLRITATAPGGHSWLHFGRASALHGIVRLGARILEIIPPERPRTTYNLGMIEGGHAINAIATQAAVWLDLRSEDPDTLAELERRVREQIAAGQGDELRFDIEVVGDRPAGRLPVEHLLVQLARAALARVGMRGVLETGSTDANVPLAHGCPAVTIGITRGGNAHRLDEYLETAPIADGLHQLMLLTLAAGQALD
jgi:tripeptide aminopeptidase